jgi:hypothetical protein
MALSFAHPLSPSVYFVIPAGANPDFLLRCTTDGRVCGFLYGKPHEVRWSHQA